MTPAEWSSSEFAAFHKAVMIDAPVDMLPDFWWQVVNCLPDVPAEFAELTRKNIYYQADWYGPAPA